MLRILLSLLVSTGILFLLLELSFCHLFSSPLLLSPLWRSVLDVYIVQTLICEASLAESYCSTQRLHYQAGILASLSSCQLLSFPRSPSPSFFLSPPLSRAPLAIQLREALRNWKRQSRKRIEKLKRKGDGELAEKRGEGARRGRGQEQGTERGVKAGARQTRRCGTRGDGGIRDLRRRWENEQISMVMKSEIWGMTWCKGENYGRDENGFWASWKKGKKKMCPKTREGIEMHSAWMGYANYRFLNYEWD